MKKISRAIIIACAAVLLLFSCKTTESGSGSQLVAVKSSKTEKLSYAQRVRSIPAKNFDSYAFSPETDLIHRLQEAPDFFLDYLKEMDGNPSYTSYSPDGTERFIIEFALQNLPPRFTSILEERLLGIYFVNDFLGSGMADFVLDEDNNLYYTLTFNPKVLTMSMTELVSYRENTCFIQDDPSLSIEVQLSDEAPGFFYILMHETAHIFDYQEHETPFVEPGLKELAAHTPESTPFTQGVWRDYHILADEDRFPYTGRISFYGMGEGPSIPISEAEEVYRSLESLPIASLYGTKSWAEDFAEMMTFLYLTEHMQIGYRIVIKQDWEEYNSWEPMLSPKVQKRADILRPLFF